MKEKNIGINILGWAVTVLMPLMVLMFSVRLLITPFFAKVEYRMPGFPEDPYGFSLEDRLKWSAPSIEYLVNSEGITFLGTLVFEDGEPIYNASELSHMEDVKAVVTGMRMALAGLMIGLVVVSGIAVRKGRRNTLLLAIRRGGWGVLGLIAVVLLLLVVNFDQLFTWFHQMFFTSGTWQFYTSDTLIRLFPMRFWQDAFIAVGGISLAIGILLIVFCKPKQN
ncbi:MAG TPA: TIGR01906 family membrane protein [Anaerolineaceae bacterium]|nr:TIGR01906 family membrane protein [Anaerolineaceae bacterium]